MLRRPIDRDNDWTGRSCSSTGRSDFIMETSLNTKITDEPARAKRMKFRALSLVAALFLSCLGPIAIAQDDKTSTDQSKDAKVQTSDKNNDKDQDKYKDDKDKEKKGSGGKDDVEAIGNRNIGGRGIGNWYSLEKEIAMGKQYAQEVEQSVKLVQDPVVTEYVNRIGQNIVRNSDAKVPFTIKVVDSDEINAFALPGGFFYVNTGLILAADDEAELAGVMAHEIAHVAARHSMRQMTRG